MAISDKIEIPGRTVLLDPDAFSTDYIIGTTVTFRGRKYEVKDIESRGGLTYPVKRLRGVGLIVREI